MKNGDRSLLNSELKSLVPAVRKDSRVVLWKYCKSQDYFYGDGNQSRRVREHEVMLTAICIQCCTTETINTAKHEISKLQLQQTSSLQISTGPKSASGNRSVVMAELFGKEMGKN